MLPKPRLLPAWRLLLLLVTPPVLAGGVLVGAWLHGRPTPAPAPAPRPAAQELPEPPGLLVHVSGAVVRPGMYRLRRGERVHAALNAAGGLLPEADQEHLPNLAGRLKDGEQVKVPFRKRPAASRSPSAGGSSPGAAAGKVSLNSATAEELATLPGFTSDLAAQAVEHRQEYGPYQSTRELVTELGMSEADYRLARSRLKV